MSLRRSAVQVACYVSSFLLLALLCTSAFAAAPLVATSIEQAGPDFAFVGEYVGTISAQVYRRQPVGLQLASLGGGQYWAVEYLGGLPGAGWTRSERRLTAGARRGSVVILTGDDREVSILGDKVLISDGHGTLKAMLRRTTRHSPTLGLQPPPEAILLFGGYDSGELRGLRVTEDGLMMEGPMTARAFQDFRLHVEFRTPYMPSAEGQARGNSGVYVQERYEVQILDSFGLEGVTNDCGGLYKQRPPDVNMSFPPLTWQTYDLEFRAARFREGEKIEAARLTLRHNGVLVHDRVAIAGKTGNGKPEGPEPRPILFQNHKDPVRFRNIWIVERHESEAAAKHASPEVHGPSPNQLAPIHTAAALP